LLTQERVLRWGFCHLHTLPAPRLGLAPFFVVMAVALILSGCKTLMSNVTGGMASNLADAMLNQDDPETVRDGAPAYLLMLDSFVQGSPGDVAMLSAAAELYAVYGVVFVDDPERAMRLTGKSLVYAGQALCESNPAGCGLAGMHLQEMNPRLEEISNRDVPALYTFGLSWLAFIQARAGEAAALAQLPQATLIMERTRELDPAYKASDVELYLAVLNTIRPPALGGDFEAGKRHFERALELSGGRDLNIKVKFARYYARTLYDRDLHDRMLNEVLEADPVQPNLTLANTLAQREARVLLETADEHF
jgi:uncharacterized protein YceK